MAGADILGIIVDKLRYEKKLYPIILLEVKKSLKIDFYYTILPFGLIVCLWMEGNEESLLNAKEIV